jgi:NodT family efflux transporter outer membrane factor (OMF) lipoprotein
MIRRRTAVLLLCFCVTLVQGNAWAWRWKVGPDYRPPKADAPVDWGTQPAQISQNDPLIAWWGQLNDPQLNALINDAIRYNYNLREAVARVREARAHETAAVGALLPNISATGGYSRNRFSDNGINPLGRFAKIGAQQTGPVPSTASGGAAPFNIGIKNPTNDFKLGFDASWELDIFGAKRWQLEAAKNRVESGIENQRSVMISLISEVARHYVELREAQSRLAIARQNINLQQQTLNLNSQKYAIGLSPKQDVTQAATQLETLKANLPPLEAAVETSAHALATLTGREPNTLLSDLSTPKAVPQAPAITAIGLPANLVLRRPDIRQAERELAAASADIASSRARLYPSVKFTGNWGWEAINLGDLFKWSSRYWMINPAVSWPIFQRMELKADVEANKARYTQREAAFRQTILEALQDVQDAVSNLEASRQQRQELAAAVAENQQTVQLTETLYRDGLNNYLNVLDARRNLASLQDRLAQSEADTTLQTIRLYKALGGGWEAF